MALVRRGLSLVGLLALVILIGACGEAAFDDGSLDELEAALADRGVAVCEESTGEVDLPGAVTTTTYELAFDCGSDDDAFVAATEYDDREHRDAAAAQYAVRSDPDLSEVWTYGAYAIVVSGPRDDAVADALTETLDELGAD
jgi:hypothetical protein